jgi:hypothetical protein
MPYESAQEFLNLIGDEVRRGSRYERGTVTGEFTDDDAPVVFIRAEDTERRTAVEQVYGRVNAVQMVWPVPPADCRGRTGTATRRLLSRCWDHCQARRHLPRRLPEQRSEPGTMSLGGPLRDSGAPAARAASETALPRQHSTRVGARFG